MSLRFEPSSDTLEPKPKILHLKSLNAQAVNNRTHTAAVTPNPKPWTLNPKPWSISFKPQTLNPKPKTLNPTPYTLHMHAVENLTYTAAVTPTPKP